MDNAQNCLSTELVNKNGPDSPCSSDPKEEWKEPEYNRKWPTKGHTSSSSRDVSPEGEYRRRPPSGHHGPSKKKCFLLLHVCSSKLMEHN